MTDIVIRRVREGDRSQWQVLWKGYQEFYETNLDAVTDSLWQKLLAENADGPICLVAERGDEIVGFTHYLFHGSCWSDKQRVYLNDLFTTPNARGQGIGRALIEAVYDAADAVDAERVYWLTHESNTAGRALYDKVAEDTGFIKYQR